MTPSCNSVRVGRILSAESITEITVICSCNYITKPGPRFVGINAALIVQKYMKRVLLYTCLNKERSWHNHFSVRAHSQTRHVLSNEFTIHTRQEEEKHILEGQVYWWKTKEGGCQPLFRCARSSWTIKKHTWSQPTSLSEAYRKSDC